MKSIYYDREFNLLYVIPNDKTDQNMRLGKINVTEQHIYYGDMYLKDVLLKGQDSEFNIYKSYI